MPMTDDELRQARELRGVNLLHVATAVTGIVPCYSVEGLKEPINFSGAVLSAIFLGRITRWNDPAILALNPTSHLPAAEIILVGHAQEDGSTYAWTDFLTKTSPEWQRAVGRVRWLFNRPALLRGQTQEEIADLVKRTPNSLSYVALWAAKGSSTQFGRIRNLSGSYIPASPTSTTAAAQTASAAIGDDFRASITNTAGSDDYPVASFTWVVIPDKFGDSEKRTVVVSFLKFVLTDGQASPEPMYLGRLPRTVADREIQMLSSVN
jgi:phosphate transport system substrate-binding protein